MEMPNVEKRCVDSQTRYRAGFYALLLTATRVQVLFFSRCASRVYTPYIPKFSFFYFFSFFPLPPLPTRPTFRERWKARKTGETNR